MKVADIARAVESLAPLALAEEWDNVGLLVGDRDAEVRRMLVCTDLTEAVLAEAVAAQAQMVLAHHPVIFKGVPRVTADETPVVYEALRRGIAVYAAHTNFDAAPGGPSDVLADVLGLADRRPLEPIVRRDLCKLVVFAPPEQLGVLADTAFSAGAGRIGRYRDCSFFCHGIGSFFGEVGARPAVGQAGRQEFAEEVRLEVVCPRAKAPAVVEALRAAHGYEMPAIDTYALEDFPPDCGHGRIGRLTRPATVQTLLNRLKKAVGVRDLLLAVATGEGEGDGGPKGGRKGRTGRKGDGKRGDGRGKLVTTAATFGGSAGGSWRRAVGAGATFLVTGEMRHHDALDAAAAGLTVACLGHGHSERLAMRRLAERLASQLRGLTTLASHRDEDPFAVV